METCTSRLPEIGWRRGVGDTGSPGSLNQQFTAQSRCKVLVDCLFFFDYNCFSVVNLSFIAARECTVPMKPYGYIRLVTSLPWSTDFRMSSSCGNSNGGEIA